MAQGVVDHLEAVQVQEHQPHPAARAGGLAKGRLEPVVEKEPVGQPRYRVQVGALEEALLLLFALGDIPQADDAGRRTLKQAGLDAEFQVEPAAVFPAAKDRHRRVRTPFELGLEVGKVFRIAK